jgi:hypothetical protein
VSLALQKKAHELVQALRQAAHARGILPVPVGKDAPAVDLVDVLRAELGRRGAQALGGQTWPVTLREALHHARIEVDSLRRGPRPSVPDGAIVFAPRHRGVDHLPVAEALAARGHAVALWRTPNDVARWPSELPHVEAAELVVKGSGFHGTVAAAKCAWLVGRLPLLPGWTDDERRRVVKAFRRVLMEQTSPASRMVSATVTLVRAHAPRVIVVGNHYTLEGRAMALTARALGVPVATFEHGSIFPGDPLWQEVPCDLVGVWGDASAEVVRQVTDARVVVTGAPKLDARLEAARQVKVSVGRTVLVATSGAGDKVSADEHAAFVRELFACARTLPDVRFAVKLHKKDRPAVYEAAAARQPASNLTWKAAEAGFGGDIYAAVAGARALVTVQSTSALDAMLMGVPVVVVDIGQRGRQKDAAFLAHARLAHDAASLAGCLREILAGTPHPTDDSARRYVASHFAHLGTATQQAAQALLDLRP